MTQCIRTGEDPRRFRLLPGVLLLLAGLTVAGEATAFRCGSKLVTEGMHITKVLAICGEPDYEQQRVVLRRNVFVGRSTRSPDGELIRRHVYAYGTPPLVEVEIRELTWNLGPNRFMRRVRFEDGIVTEVEKLDRGYLE